MEGGGREGRRLEGRREGGEEGKRGKEGEGMKGVCYPYYYQQVDTENPYHLFLVKIWSV